MMYRASIRKLRTVATPFGYRTKPGRIVATGEPAATEAAALLGAVRAYNRKHGPGAARVVGSAVAFDDPIIAREMTWRVVPHSAPEPEQSGLGI